MQLLLCALFLSAQASSGAEALWRAGNRVKALESMAAELAETPQNARLRTLLVRRELELGRPQSAFDHCSGLPEEELGLRGRALYFLTRYEEALEFLRLDDNGELLMRAECSRALGRFEEVELLLPNLREKLGPKTSSVRMIEARLALRRKQFDLALPILREVLVTDPLEAEALFALGSALVRQGKRAEGLRLLERHRNLMPLLDQLDFARRGVALAPLGGPNQAALGDALRALQSHDARLAAQAQAAYTRAFALAAPEELPPIALRCARFRWESLEDPKGATELLLSAIERRDDARLRVRLADYFAELGQTRQALDQLEEVARSRPGDRAIRERIAELRKTDECL